MFITVCSKSPISSILWHFEINADVSSLDKSVIQALPLCVLRGYSLLNYTNDSLTYWLLDRIKIMIENKFIWIRKAFLHYWLYQVLLMNLEKKHIIW